MRPELVLAALCGGLLAVSASCVDEPFVVRGAGSDGGSGGAGDGGQAGASTQAGTGGQVGTGGEGASGGTGGSPAPELHLDFEAVDLDGDPSRVTHFEFFPGSNEFLVATRPGRVMHYELVENRTELLGEFQIPELHVEQDCGLISLTFDPDFDDNHYLYAGICVSQQESAIVRYEFDSEAYDEIGDSEVEIFRAGDSTATSAIHNVGKMGFDEAGNLWATLGDKGVGSNAQDTTTPLGSLLRLRPLPEGGYEAPDPPNPELEDGLDVQVIYAYGLRSPWTGLLDSRGRYWLGDVGASGEASIEEINLVDAPGLNLGWSDTAGPCERNCNGLTDPVRWWARGPTNEFDLADPDEAPAINRVAWVGVEYAGFQKDRYDGLMTNKVLYGDMCLGYVRAVEVDRSGKVVYDAHVGHLEGASAWKVGPDGFIYASLHQRCTHGSSKELPPGKLMRARLASD